MLNMFNSRTGCPWLSYRILTPLASSHVVCFRRSRRKLRKLACWSRWKLAETVQLNSMDKDGMYGPPCRPPADAIVLRQVWKYNVKYEGTLKAHNCCDGSVLKGRGIEYAQHYTACISQQGMVIFWAITALRGWVAIGADAVNAFAKSPPPSEPTFVLIDAQMREWLNEQKGIQVSDGDVHPVYVPCRGILNRVPFGQTR
jgi:hypothetical protein